jgi:hypothetical protein
MGFASFACTSYKVTGKSGERHLEEKTMVDLALGEPRPTDGFHLSTGEIDSERLSAFKRNIRDGAVMGYGGLLPFGALVILFQLPIMIAPAALGIADPAASMGVIGGLVILSLVFMGFTTAMMLSAFARLQESDGFLDKRACFEDAAEHFWPVLAIILIKIPAFLIGAILGVVPGFVVLAAFSIAGALVMNENMGVIEALKESARRTKGLRWKLAGVHASKILISVPGIMLFSAIIAIGFMDSTAMEAAQEAGRDPPPPPWQIQLATIQIYLVFATAFEVVIYQWLKARG